MLILGLMLGIGGGVIYAWFFNPVNYVNVGPDRLTQDDQQAYVLLVGEAYLQDGDLDRARARLSALGVRDIAKLVSIEADSYLLRGADPAEVRALATLAEALGAQPLAASVFSGTVAPGATPLPAAATPTFEAMPSPTPVIPTETPTPEETPITPTATPDRFAGTQLNLVDQTETCADNDPIGLIAILVTDENGDGIPGVAVRVDWSGGSDTFYTGLKPDVDPGYADFLMQADQRYSVTLVGLSEPVVGLDSSGCRTPSGQTSIPTYRLTFAPPTG